MRYAARCAMRERAIDEVFAVSTDWSETCHRSEESRLLKRHPLALLSLGRDAGSSPDGSGDQAPRQPQRRESFSEFVPHERYRELQLPPSRTGAFKLLLLLMLLLLQLQLLLLTLMLMHALCCC